jgi:hypothetical protein
LGPEALGRDPVPGRLPDSEPTQARRNPTAMATRTPPVLTIAGPAGDHPRRNRGVRP